MNTVVLEEAFREDGCPVCRLLLQSQQDWLWMLLWENVNDVGTRKVIGTSLGFCHRHDWLLANLERNEWGSNAGTAIIYEDLTNRLLERCGDMPINKKNHSRQAYVRPEHLHGALPGSPCPACAAASTIEDIYIHWLSKYCAEDWFASEYRQSHGLCMEHFGQALSHSSPSVRALLLMVQLANLKTAQPQALAAGSRVHSQGDTGLDIGHRLGLLAGLNPYLPVKRKRSLLQNPLPMQPLSSTPGKRCRCPVCAIEREAADRELMGLLSLVHPADPPNHWLCAEHAWRLHLLAADSSYFDSVKTWSAGVAETTMDELGKLLFEEQLAARKRYLIRWWQSRRKRVDAALARECAACAEIRRASDEWADRAFSPRYVESDGVGVASLDLCLRHSASVLKRISPSVTTAVRQRQMERLRELSYELREYLRKHDWNHRHEPRGREQGSARRAVSLFVGDE